MKHEKEVCFKLFVRKMWSRISGSIIELFSPTCMAISASLSRDRGNVRASDQQPEVGATTSVVIYKDHWQIEIFYKALKQYLKIKTFVGTSPNDVRIQIWTALIVILILRFLKLRSQLNRSFSNLVALLRMNLFAHRDLWAWLNHPFQVDPIPYEPESCI